MKIVGSRWYMVDRKKRSVDNMFYSQMLLISTKYTFKETTE